jgi:hypothetical protein
LLKAPVGFEQRQQRDTSHMSFVVTVPIPIVPASLRTSTRGQKFYHEKESPPPLLVFQNLIQIFDSNYLHDCDLSDITVRGSKMGTRSCSTVSSRKRWSYEKYSLGHDESVTEWWDTGPGSDSK